MAYTYLALGDSYTIGEKVLFNENYPSQLVQQLRKEGFNINAPEVIAKTGWTTDELQLAIQNHQFLEKYDFVSLLIGVNNQYRGYPISEYENQFEKILLQAIQFAGNKKTHLVVISIPDWGVTPFAEGRDREQIKKEIDQFNDTNKKISAKYNIHYIDITSLTREAGADVSLLTDDGLHPSAKDYHRWVEKIANFIIPVLQQEIR